MHRDRRYNNAGDYKYWGTVYRDGFAATIFATNQLLNELKSYSYKDQLWVWTSADYRRRVMEFDSIYWDGSSSGYTTDPNHKIQFRAAGFLSQGGTASNGWQNDSIWRLWSNTYPCRSSTGVAEPMMYYRMFVESYTPAISFVTTH